MAHLQTFLQAVETDLGEPSGWGSLVEFPDSLALCALNSAYSLRAHTQLVSCGFWTGTEHSVRAPTRTAGLTCSG